MNHAVRAARVATESDPKRLGFYLDLCVVAGFLKTEAGSQMLRTADRVGATVFSAAQRKHAADNARYIADYGWALMRSYWQRGPTALVDWSPDKLDDDAPGVYIPCVFHVCMLVMLYVVVIFSKFGVCACIQNHWWPFVLSFKIPGPGKLHG